MASVGRDDTEVCLGSGRSLSWHLCRRLPSHGSLAGIGDVGGNARLWDLRIGKPIVSLGGHVKQVLGLDFASNGYQAATCSGDNTIRIWDLRKRHCTYTIPGHLNMVSNVRFGPDSKFLLTSSYDNTCRLRSSHDFTQVMTLRGHEDKVSRAEMSPGTSIWWNVLNTKTEEGFILTHIFIDCKYVVTTSFDHTVKLWTSENTSQVEREALDATMN